eukprot:TRINITY_DN3209_c0_g1_i1.p1 TRINITY_DN3209_c0_g1~~TRINITY_DN3209_c0_g1_i1.p1  ORF type:complete len:693 (-),score=119.76 TRINITY_DN3209_c0_g1_i1:2010-4088(-)
MSLSRALVEAVNHARKRGLEISSAEEETASKKAAATVERRASLQDLPDDLLQVIFKGFSVRNLFTLRGLCTHFRDFFYHSCQTVKIGGACAIARDVVSLTQFITKFQVQRLKLAHVPGLSDGSIGLLVQNCVHLIALSVKDCLGVTGLVLQQLGPYLPRLEELCLDDVPVTEASISSIAACRKLRVLSLMLVGEFKKVKTKALFDAFRGLEKLHLNAGAESVEFLASLRQGASAARCKTRAFLIANFLPNLAEHSRNLRELVLKGARFSPAPADTVCAFVQRCTELRMLHMSSSQVLDSKASAALNLHCTQLTSLKMNHVADLQSLSGLLHLRKLAIGRSSRITRMTRDIVSDLPLQSLTLVAPRFVPYSMPTLQKLKLIDPVGPLNDNLRSLCVSSGTRLTWLTLRHTQTSHQSLSAIFEHCTSLTHLEVSARPAGSDSVSAQTIQAALRGCLNLQYLDVDNVDDVSEPFFVQLSRSSSQLRALILRVAPARITTNSLSVFFAACTQLRVLHIEGEFTENQISMAINALPQLRRLRMNLCVDDGAVSLRLVTAVSQKLRWLRELSLGPAAIYHSTSLRLLCNMLAFQLLWIPPRFTGSFASFQALERAMIPHGVVVKPIEVPPQVDIGADSGAPVVAVAPAHGGELAPPPPQVRIRPAPQAGPAAPASAANLVAHLHPLYSMNQSDDDDSD